MDSSQLSIFHLLFNSFRFWLCVKVVKLSGLSIRHFFVHSRLFHPSGFVVAHLFIKGALVATSRMTWHWYFHGSFPINLTQSKLWEDWKMEEWEEEWFDKLFVISVFPSSTCRRADYRCERWGSPAVAACLIMLAQACQPCLVTLHKCLSTSSSLNSFPAETQQASFIFCCFALSSLGSRAGEHGETSGRSESRQRGRRDPAHQFSATFFCPWRVLMLVLFVITMILCWPICAHYHNLTPSTDSFMELTISQKPQLQ